MNERDEAVLYKHVRAELIGNIEAHGVKVLPGLPIESLALMSVKITARPLRTSAGRAIRIASRFES